MSKKIIYLLCIVTMLIISIFWMSQVYNGDKVTMKSKNGEIDASAYESGVYDLTGTWFFVPNESDVTKSYSNTFLRDFDVKWADEALMDHSVYGSAIYTTTLIGLEADTIYGLQSLNQLAGFELYANGELVANNGRYDEYLEWRTVAVPVTSDSEGNIELKMLVFNDSFSRGRFVNPIKFGLWEEVNDIYMSNNMLFTFLVSSIFAMGIFFLGYYVMHYQETVVLHFAVFSIMVGIYSLLTGYRLIHFLIPGLPWNLLVRLEHMLGYMLLPMFLIFVFNLLQVWVKYIKYLYVVLGLVAVICLFTPHGFYESLLDGYRYVGALGLAFLEILFFIMYFKDKKGSMLMILSTNVLLLTSIKEIEFRSRINYMPHGTFFLVLCFSYLTLDKIVDVYRRNSVLEQKVAIDPITGLFNREILLQTLENYIGKKSKEESYLVFIDTNNLKVINEANGHKAGDEVLKEVANRLEGAICDRCRLYRYMGDIFAVFMENADIEKVYTLVERLKGSMEEPIELYGRDNKLDINVGFSKYREEYDIEKWLEVADGAMFKDKAFKV